MSCKVSFKYVFKFSALVGGPLAFFYLQEPETNPPAPHAGRKSTNTDSSECFFKSVDRFFAITITVNRLNRYLSEKVTSVVH